MRRLFFVLFVVVFTMQLSAQDSLRSPFSVYGGGGIGLGWLLGGYGELPNGYDDLQYEEKLYVDMQFKSGILWNERIGVALLAGQLGKSNDGTKYTSYAESAYAGYKFLPEYSDLHFGYKYRYFTPQLVYRIGREPFNLTANAGAGIGLLRSANGLAIYQEEASNDFLEVRYNADPSWNLNIAIGLNFAYMRQLSQHWFMNTGFNLGYIGIKENYEIVSTTQKNQQQFALASPSHLDAIVHHISFGVFVHFQWNTKEYERAYYE